MQATSGVCEVSRRRRHLRKVGDRVGALARRVAAADRRAEQLREAAEPAGAVVGRLPRLGELDRRERARLARLSTVGGGGRGCLLYTSDAADDM
eukprot:3592153-Prymnesium_polylepis.1